jgi:hypothetical protein
VASASHPLASVRRCSSVFRFIGLLSVCGGAGLFGMNGKVPIQCLPSRPSHRSELTGPGELDVWDEALCCPLAEGANRWAVLLIREKP